jgi:hypothetical protein
MDLAREKTQHACDRDVSAKRPGIQSIQLIDRKPIRASGKSSPRCNSSEGTKEENMTILARTHIACAIALIAGAAILATAAFAQQGGTAEEAKAMLVKAVAAVKQDKN